jgi:hypothetical protein
MGTEAGRLSWVEWDARMATAARATRSFAQSGVLGDAVGRRRTLVTLNGLMALAGLAAGPSVGTALWTAIGPGAPFLVGGTVKIAYDLTLWWMFRQVKPPEEVVG